MVLVLMTRNLVTFQEISWGRILCGERSNLTSPELVIGPGWGQGKEMSRGWNVACTSAPFTLMRMFFLRVPHGRIRITAH